MVVMYSKPRAVFGIGLPSASTNWPPRTVVFGQRNNAARRVLRPRHACESVRGLSAANQPGTCPMAPVPFAASTRTATGQVRARDFIKSLNYQAGASATGPASIISGLMFRNFSKFLLNLPLSSSAALSYAFLSLQDARGSSNSAGTPGHDLGTITLKNG